ncbi:MAG: hypothetical protein KGN74_08430 [Gemmatimonadota bacterium]|nr:hypothetical protein [Gemmatimonadota bacterium]
MTWTRPVRAALLSGLTVLLPVAAPAALSAQSAPPGSAPRGRLTLHMGYEQGPPSGWVQVRENRIDGSRLSLARDLGVHSVSSVAVGLERSAGSGAFGLTVTASTLRGSAVIAQPVYFNGSTLAAGTVLRTRTEAGDFLRVVVGYAHPLARVGSSGELIGRAGLDATLLDFRLQGTLAPGSSGHETKEDFVTQELPAPFLGAQLRLPLNRRVAFHVGADGGGLPWVSSLRYEGGLVHLSQSRFDADAGVDVALSAPLTLGAGLHATGFAQNEQSREDGNRFALASTALALDLRWRF